MILLLQVGDLSLSLGCYLLAALVDVVEGKNACFLLYPPSFAER